MEGRSIDPPCASTVVAAMAVTGGGGDFAWKEEGWRQRFSVRGKRKKTTKVKRKWEGRSAELYKERREGVFG